MYDVFYGFREKPFSLLPDPDYLYLSPQHEKALGLLELSLHNQAGFCVISGEIGAGKTTLIRKLLTLAGPEFRVGLVSNTLDSFGELMNWILMAFALRGGGGPVEQHERFIDFVIQQYGRGRRTVLIIDEAQNLGVEALEELRMLSNVNADKHQVLQVILVGQAGLRETLRRPELAQFAQRILMDFHLGPLGREDTARYIRHRTLVAGADPQLFSEEATAAVFRYSNGVPRIINLLCDTALVYGYAEGSPAISEELIHAVVRERQASSVTPALRLAAVAPPAAAAAPEPAVAPQAAASPAEPPAGPMGMAAAALEGAGEPAPGIASRAPAPDAVPRPPAPVEADDDTEWLQRLADSAVPPALRGAEPKPKPSESPVAATREQPRPATVVPRQPKSVPRSRRGDRAAGLAALLLAGAGAYWYWSGGDPDAGPAGAVAAGHPEAARLSAAEPMAGVPRGPDVPQAGMATPEPEGSAEPSPVPPSPAVPTVVAPVEAVGPPVSPSAEPAVQPESPARVSTREPEREAPRAASPAPRPAARPTTTPAPRAVPPVVVSQPAPAAPVPAPAPVSGPDPEPLPPVAAGVPEPVRDLAQPASGALAEAESPVAAAGAQAVPVRSEPQPFTTDPCRGPAAHYLSTCR